MNTEVSVTDNLAACSIAGMRGYPGFSAYSSTKFAVRSLNQSASQELAPHKINCNVYCPSPVPTTMWTAIDKDLTGLTGAPLGAITEQVSRGRYLSTRVRKTNRAAH